MLKNNTTEAVKYTAEKMQISVEELVRRIETEIQIALTKTLQRECGLENSLWNDIPRCGEIPTAYELIEFLAEKVAEYPNRNTIWK